MSDSLVIKNLNASIGERAILKDFSLTVPKGEVHAIMGPNGTKEVWDDATVAREELENFLTTK